MSVAPPGAIEGRVVACADGGPNTHGTPEGPSFLRKGELAITDSEPFMSSAVILQILGPITANKALFAVILLKTDRLTAVLAAQVR